MTTETDITFFIKKTGVILMVKRIRILCSTIWSNIMALTCFAYITVKNNLSIYGYGDTVTNSFDFFCMPLLDRPEINMLRGYYTVNSTMVLIRTKARISKWIALVYRIVMVKNLDFHTLISTASTPVTSLPVRIPIPLFTAGTSK